MAQKKKSRKKNKKLSWGRYALLFIAGTILIVLYFLFAPNTGSFTNGEYLYIHTGSDYEQVKTALGKGGFIRDMTSFDLLAKKEQYSNQVYPGKYYITRNMSNYSIIKMLIAGSQTAVPLKIGKIRRKQDLIRLISSNLEADSTVLKQMFKDTTYLAQFGLDTNSVMCGVLPDTYEFRWNTTADEAFRRIEKSYVRFWSDDRIAKAKAKKLTPQEVIIVASIIEEETNRNAEKPSIASVYLNRKEQGMKLQADPTAKFAYGDFALRRITTDQTTLASPYNTYYISGLPIGPICTPSAASIDAVLDAPKTTYLYFCASGRGGHLFASTYNEHLKNAKRYHQLLNHRNIH